MLVAEPAALLLPELLLLCRRWRRSVQLAWVVDERQVDAVQHVRIGQDCSCPRRCSGCSDGCSSSRRCRAEHAVIMAMIMAVIVSPPQPGAVRHAHSLLLLMYICMVSTQAWHRPTSIVP